MADDRRSLSKLGLAVATASLILTTACQPASEQGQPVTVDDPTLAFAETTLLSGTPELATTTAPSTTTPTTQPPTTELPATEPSIDPIRSLGSLSPHNCDPGYSLDSVYTPPDYLENGRPFEVWIGSETSDLPDVLGWDVELFADISDDSAHDFEWTFEPHQMQPGNIPIFDVAYAEMIESLGISYNVDFANDYQLNVADVEPYLQAIDDDELLQYLFFSEPRSTSAGDREAIEDSLLLMPFLFHLFDDVILDVGLDETTAGEIVTFDGVTRPAIDTVTTGLDERGCFFYVWEQRLDTDALSEVDQAGILQDISDAYGISVSRLDIENFVFSYTTSGLINPHTSEVIEVVSVDRLYAAHAIGYTTFTHLRFKSYDV